MRAASLFVCLAVMSTLSVQASPQQGKSKPNTTTPVPLAVTVEDTMGDGTACAICPANGDPASVYTNGQYGVSANLDQYGNLIVDFGTGVVGFNFSQPFDEATPDLNLPGGSHAGSYLATRRPQPAGHMQDLAIGQSQCVEFNWVFKVNDSKQTEYRIQYQRDAGGDITNTSYVQATRTSDTNWVLEPALYECGNGGAALADVVSTPTRGKTVYTDYRRYVMPFRLTLTALQ